MSVASVGLSGVHALIDADASKGKKWEIAIDGPARVGKGTLAIQIADRLCLYYINSGAIFRAVTLVAIRNGIDVQDFSETNQLRIAGFVQKVNPADLENPELRVPEVTKAVPIVGQHPIVRSRVREFQNRLWAKSPRGVVAEGRDIGTTVFPNAKFKFFLTASLEAQTERELISRNQNTRDPHLFNEVSRAIRARDEEDRNRSIHPLVQADDAHLIDNTDLSIDGTLEVVMHHILRECGCLSD